jgi:hypothetical protein
MWVEIIFLRGSGLRFGVRVARGWGTGGEKMGERCAGDGCAVLEGQVYN